MHVLVTGGAGYIGSTLVPMLLARGHRVTVVDRFYFGDTLAGVGSDGMLSRVRADVRRVDPRVFEGVEAVVDLAGISNDPACELDASLTRSVNLEGSRRVHRLAQAAGVRRVVVASSCSVYGHGEGTQLVETSPRHPVSLYAECKAGVEDSLLELGRASGMTVTALRFATVFGVSRRMRFDLAVNVMTKNAYTQRRIVVDGGGKQWRPFVHVRDVSEALARTLEADEARVAGQVINVGSSENNLRILTLGYRIRDAVPGTEVEVSGSDPDLRDYNVNFDKLRAVLDWSPRVTVDDGIAEVLAALRAGEVDPDDRRGYTLKTYVFLAEVERSFREVAIDGMILE
ncbi:MAG: SDR family oxidoreductase [Polyangiaceae bacterium]|nr:SDR family oxidoreductase [Polyangiaceae bacterium]